MADLGILTALLGQTQQTSYSQDSVLTTLLGGATDTADSESALIAQFLGGGSQTESDPFMALLGGSLGGDLSALTGAQSESDPLLALLGGGSVIDDFTRGARIGRPIPKPDPNNVKLETYYVNLARVIADNKALGGNGDNKVSRQELGMAKTVVTLLSKIGGNNNPTLKAITKTIDSLSREEVFSAIASKDGENGQNSTIGATDIVLAALSDKDRDINTIHLNVKPAASNNPLEQLIALLTGQGLG